MTGISVPEVDKPVITYFHETGYSEAFGAGRDGIFAGVIYMSEIEHDHKQIIEPAKYVLSALWGDKGTKIAELWGYGEFKEWPENPTLFRPWVFRDGVYVPEPDSIGCEDMTIAFGIESQHRRKCVNLGEFMSHRPELPDYLWSANRITV